MVQGNPNGVQMVTFVAPAFHEDPYAFIGSLRAQTNPNWKCIVFHNGRNGHLQAILDTIKDNRISYKESPENTGAWGCYNRIDALAQVDTPYVVQTSIQDYYLPTTVEAIIANYGKDIIYWDSINHLTGPDRLDCSLNPGKVDWGNVAVWTKLAQKVGINHPKEFIADWLFVQDLLQELPTTVKVDRILTIHN